MNGLPDVQHVKRCPSIARPPATMQIAWGHAARSVAERDSIPTLSGGIAGQARTQGCINAGELVSYDSPLPSVAAE